MPVNNETPKYPLLEGMLAVKGLSLQPTYSNRDVALLFGVSVRAIQDRVSSGQLIARDLPGKAKFLPIDLEEFLRNSRKRRCEPALESSQFRTMSPDSAARTHKR